MTQPDQRAMWNGPSGEAWIEWQAVLDGLFRPFEDVLVAAVAPGARVLDVGCGTGATTIAIARVAGRAVGFDLSAPMIEVARARAAGAADFLVGDAQTYAFEPASFDAITSRFGVMFFDDPLAAFANLRRAAAPGAKLRVITWRSAAENPFMTTAERAAAPLVELPARAANGPGQFAFADPDRVRAILEPAGWSRLAFAPLDVPATLPEPMLGAYASRLGPLGRVLASADDATRARVMSTVRAAFDPFVHGSDVRFTCACWQVDAIA